MEEKTVAVPAEQHDRLVAIAAARGVTPEAQLVRLIDDAYAGLDGDGPPADTLPLGVCDGSDAEAAEQD